MAGAHYQEVDVIPVQQEQSGFHCTHCQRELAVIFCKDCKKYLCNRCVTPICEQHETRPIRVTIYQRTAKAHPQPALHLNEIIKGVDGYYYVVDMDNNLLKKFNTKLDVVSFCGLPCRPWAVCSFYEHDHHSVAITVRGKKMVVIAETEPRFHVVREFITPDRCRGIAHTTNRLIVACGGNDSQATADLEEGIGQIVVFNMIGEVLFALKEGISQPFHVHVGPSGSIFICDRDNGVYVCKMDQNSLIPLKLLSNDQQSYTYTVTETPQWEIFVGSHNPNSITKYDANGQLIGTVLSEVQIKKPLSILFDNLRLFVTNEGSDNIQVFNITEGDV